ncbi:MAG: FKBP-type peptidyl-prolyl cis-trans isomerase, partial [Acidimicrobiales bacterium]|nr:FKBP-type peptidyl-prolyl cis-trans isomerase [Acidimicrobiales bacterium]
THPGASPMRRILVVLTAFALLGAACGEEEPTRSTGDTTTTGVPLPDDLKTTDLDDVKVVGEPGSEPTLEFEAPFGVSETARRVIDEGDGDGATDGNNVTFNFLFVNGRTGDTVQSSYGDEPVSLVLEDSLLPAVYEALTGAKVGARVLVAIAPTEGGGADETSGIEASDTILFFAEVLSISVPLERAEGTAVTPAAGLPTVVLDADGVPTITVPEGAPPAELVIQPLIQGDGATVEAGQSITVHYTGALYADGSVFDSSWQRGTPATFSIGTGGVIAGWDKGLVGQKIGSQILLVIPAADGYGDEGSGENIPAGATLVFVVDILAAA